MFSFIQFYFLMLFQYISKFEKYNKKNFMKQNQSCWASFTYAVHLRVFPDAKDNLGYF